LDQEQPYARDIAMRLNQPLKSAVVPPIDNVVNGVLQQLEHFSVFARGNH
jgi:hypothetical protein